MNLFEITCDGPPLKSIEEEASACIAAWEACPDAEFAWFCHHEMRLEPMEPAGDSGAPLWVQSSQFFPSGTRMWAVRIAYVLENKRLHERAIRLRNFRPVRISLDDRTLQLGRDLRKASEEQRRLRRVPLSSPQDAFAYVEACDRYLRLTRQWDRQVRELDIVAAHNNDWPDNTVGYRNDRVC